MKQETSFNLSSKIKVKLTHQGMLQWMHAQNKIFSQHSAPTNEFDQQPLSWFINQRDKDGYVTISISAFMIYFSKAILSGDAIISGDIILLPD